MKKQQLQGINYTKISKYLRTFGKLHLTDSTEAFTRRCSAKKLLGIFRKIYKACARVIL